MARQDVRIRPAASYQIYYSTSPDRSNPVALDGAALSSPTVYIFVSPTTSIASVAWWKDDVLYRTDSTPEFDLEGDSGGSAIASSLSAGSFTYRAVVTTTLSNVYTLEANFSVSYSPAPESVDAVAGVGSPTISASSTVALPSAVSASSFVPSPNVSTGSGTVLTADQNSNSVTRRVYDLMRALGDPNDTTNRVMTGQHIGNATSSTAYDTNLMNITGITSKPAVMGVDYDTRSASTTTLNYTGVNNAMKAHWDAGGLVTISIHAANPETTGSYTDMTCNIANLITPGHATYNAWRTMLDGYAVGLSDLQSRGVTVLWRPFHEMNNSAWWWTYRNTTMTAARFKTMWQQMFDYLTTTKGLHNLLWVYSPHISDPSGQGRTVWYPGDAYVDVVGLDNYKYGTRTNGTRTYDQTSTGAADSTNINIVNSFQASFSNKPFAMTETGKNSGASSLDSAIERDIYLNTHKFVTYTLRWRNGHQWTAVNCPNPATFFNDGIVMNRDEVVY